VLLRLIALSSLAFSSALSAADIPKQPTGKWVAEYGEDECLLSRPYGTDENLLMLTFRELPMDESARVIVFTSEGHNEPYMGEKGHLTLGSERMAKSFNSFRLAGKAIRRIETTVKRSGLMAAVPSGTVSVDIPGEMKETFVVPGFQSALDVLGDCALKLGAAWGIPIEQQKRMKTAAKLSGSPFTAFDFPDSALKKELNGRTQVRLTVDENGRPLDCFPLKSTPDPVFARTSCNVLMKRAHFQPATDIDGKPMKSIYIQSVYFLAG
jgi:hypothetical protein